MRIKFSALPTREIIDYPALAEMVDAARDGMIFLTDADAQALGTCPGNYRLSLQKAKNPKGS